ncbi:MAG: ATP-binding cassette domain-containing protein [Polynucleobacter sp.]
MHNNQIELNEIQKVDDISEWKSGVSLTIRNLKKSYGDRSVLEGINLDIEPGEFVAIVGRSGCGKSTLLRLVAGLERISSGDLHLDHVYLPSNTDTRIMFQEARLLPWKKVLQNVAIGLSSGALQRAKDVLAAVGLSDRGDEWPARLSGGQKQRVALARALVHKPKLLLLDEPLGALDALTRIEMHQLIETLWTKNGFTALLVTHDVAEAIALADRIILIEDGAIALNLKVDLPRPRERASQKFVEIEKRLLDQLLNSVH